jgi:hypothetical protein
MNVDLVMQVNNAGVGGVVVDQDALRALNIDPDTWVCRLFMTLNIFAWLQMAFL